MIGDLASMALAENSQRIPFQKRAIISLSGRPLKENDGPGPHTDCRYTDFMYYLKYMPSQLPQYKDRPFVIVGDIFKNGKFRTRDYNYTKYFYGKQSEEVQWVIEHTNLCQELFDLAFQNIQMAIPISVDVLGLDKELREKKGEPDSKYSMFKDPIIAKAERMRYEQFIYAYKHKGSNVKV